MCQNEIIQILGNEPPSVDAIKLTGVVVDDKGAHFCRKCYGYEKIIRFGKTYGMSATNIKDKLNKIAVDIDYSNIEMRVAGHFMEENEIEAIRNRQRDNNFKIR
jgi:hypothetical protein